MSTQIFHWMVRNGSVLTDPVKALEATFAFIMQGALKAAKNEHHHD